MDRNLGASKVAESMDDDRAYGWLYQWGRLSDGHQDPASLESTQLSDGDVPGHGKYINASSIPFDWRDPQNDIRWQGVTGVNNPCPPDFRLPTAAEWEVEIASWGANQNAAGAFASPLKLVTAGNRALGNVGYRGSGFYYTSDIQITIDINGRLSRAYHLIIKDDEAILTFYNYATTAMSVRCIKD